MIYLKYLKAAISYHKETRVETYPFARDAVREAVFNALIDCNWADNVPVLIRIGDDAMFISNCSMLSFGWTAERLLGAHASKPYNPDIARVFYCAGYIESWRRGIQKTLNLQWAEIAEKLNVTKRTIERMVKHLREKGAIERKGGKRYGYWEIHEEQ